VIDWQQLVRWGAEQKASDVFFKPGAQPALRVKGQVQPVEGWPAIKPEDTEQVARGLMTDRDWERFLDYPRRTSG